MKPAISISVSKDANLCLVTTEDGVIAFAADAGLDESQLGVLVRTDYSINEFRYLPQVLLNLTKEIATDWENVYKATIH